MRKLLKDDAIPTLFEHNKDKSTQKRRCSEVRDAKKAKRQMCEDAMALQERVEQFEFELNTKGTQTDITLENFPDLDTVTNNVESNEHFDFEIIRNNDEPGTSKSSESTNPNLSETESVESFHEKDSDFVESEVSEASEDEEIENMSPKPSKAAFIVYWSSLLLLLNKCLRSTCMLPATVKKIVYKGSQLIVHLKCQDGHETEWRSQPNVNRYSVGNLSSAASVLFSANTYSRLAQHFLTSQE